MDCIWFCRQGVIWRSLNFFLCVVFTLLLTSCFFCTILDYACSFFWCRHDWINIHMSRYNPFWCFHDDICFAHQLSLNPTQTSAHSLIFTSAFPLGRVAGKTALWGLEIPDSFQQSQILLLAPQQDGTKQGRCSYGALPGPWSTYGPLSRGCSQQDLPRQSLLGYFYYMAEKNIGEVRLFGRSGSTFRTCNSQLSTLPRNVTSWTLRKNPVCAACTWDSALSIFTHDS